MSQTIFTQTPNQYHVQKTVGGWVVVFIQDRHNMRPVDGEKVYPQRQGAYRRAKRLNDLKAKMLGKVIETQDLLQEC